MGTDRRAAGERVVAVQIASVTRARDYATKRGIPAAYTDLDLLLTDPAIQVVYIFASSG